MHPISPPLSRDDEGPEVANLQTGLTLLLDREVIQVERGVRLELLNGIAREYQTYEDNTGKTVSIFQEERHLEPSGIVDVDTADALNVALRLLGAFDDGQAGAARRTVAGQVLKGEGSAFAGRVVLFEENSEGTLHLGEDVTDPEGRYAVAYALPDGAEGPVLRVAAFDSGGRTRAEETFEAPRPLTVVNLVVGSDQPVFSVSGRLSSCGCTGVGDLRIVIVDRNVGGDTTLAEAQTDRDGTYRITFSYRARKARPDLQARAFSGETLLGTSDVRYGAANEETLDISLEGTAPAALTTEHEMLLGDIAAHFTGSLGGLVEDGDRADVTYLANKTGWDARAVALASLAEQFSARTTDSADAPAIHPALFYALFRSGLPAHDAAIYGMDAQSVGAIWKQGLEQGIVPASLAQTIPAALDRFQTLSAQQALTGPAFAGLSTLGEMFKVSLPNADEADHKKFAHLQVVHEGDPGSFWEAVQTSFGVPAALRLALDGQLGYLTLNNAPLIDKLHTTANDAPLASPVELVGRGYHRPEQWLELIDATPPGIPGDDEKARKANYADVMAAQLRLSYPTATVAALVKSGDTSTEQAVGDQVHDWLLLHHDRFHIGMQPVEQYAARNKIEIDPDVKHAITSIQRVRQITPSDYAMSALLKGKITSAYDVTRYDRGEFVATFKDEVGGETQAALIHARAQQVHAAVLNVAASYVLASSAPGIGLSGPAKNSPARIIDPAPNVPDHVGDVIAYPTLQTLLGGMDYCDCEHCRSVLSPAAYLVDLLQFLDRDEDRWKQFLERWPKEHGGAPYPFEGLEAWQAAGPTDPAVTPLEVFLALRPDVQQLPLTCDNTNIPVPYIDLVNETLEYFVANGSTLHGFKGHTTDDRATPEELLANPQFVQDTAYDILAGKPDPKPLLPPTPPLPFHRPLEHLRRLLDAFHVPLPRVMEALRKDDALESTSDADYGWRDIWMEQLRISRPQYALLTHCAPTLQQSYGFPSTTSDDVTRVALSHAKGFSRRLAISYDDVLTLLRTRFINPNGVLIPKLERLGVRLDTLKAFRDGKITPQQFDDALAPQIDAAQYGGDIRAWVTNQANWEKIKGLLVLADPAGSNTTCNFDALEFRYADPARLGELVRPFEFIRLLRLVRLWKSLGWSVEQTDKAITALYPADQTPDLLDEAVNRQRLDAGFQTLLPRLGVLARVIERLDLTVAGDLLPLLACFAPMDTYGPDSLYRALFSKPATLKQDPVFAEDGYGNFLGGSQRLLKHREALCAALTLTADEFASIIAALHFNTDTRLTVDNVSRVFRRGWLARTLKLSVEELLLLIKYSGIDPFAAIDPADPAILRLVDLVDRLRTAGLTPSQALYLIWNADPSGTSPPSPAETNAFIRGLRAEFAEVERDFGVADDPDGRITRTRLALVYDDATADLFLGLLNNTVVSDTPYNHHQPQLEQPILDAAQGRLSYDDFRKRLSFTGTMTPRTLDALKAVADTSDALKQAIDALYREHQQILLPFFTRYPELKPPYDAYIASDEPAQHKRTALLTSLLPTLKQRRKRQQALQMISAAAKTDVAFGAAILDNAAVLHQVADPAHPALDDLVALDTAGLSADFFFRDTATGQADRSSDAEPTLDYGPGATQTLPDSRGNPLSGIWSGTIEAPADDFYNIRIDTDADANVTLTLGEGPPLLLTRNGNQWTNATPIELRGGVLHRIALRVDNVRDTLNLRWQTAGNGWGAVPARYLYSATSSDRLLQTYARFSKTASLAAGLKLTAGECVYLATHPDLRIHPGWLNGLPVTGPPDDATVDTLTAAFEALVEFAHIKAAFSPDDERLLAVLQNLEAAAEPNGPLFTLTGWDTGSLTTLLDRLGATTADLAHLQTLRRIRTAFQHLTALGISANTLIAAATNDPTSDAVRDLQDALRARYAVSDWLSRVKPINDDLRRRQRDALVSYVLHQMRSTPTPTHIDTADKLFEYFLMDVQMEPCMETSRIRSALSAAQLFIERCLANLEPRVAPAALNPGQWGWMKRYRVWEANRKVFLWPENWLEPELRDDQSPFFKDLMSELLQSDITEDAATTALGTYLQKLDTVAKLEPCGIHFLENDPGTTDDVAYVVARTAGASRTYYWRRRESGSWTPWEQIALDIDDNPVIPVLWKNRLLLFWLKILQQTDVTSPPFNVDNPDKDLTQLQIKEIGTDPPQVTIQAMLCWSEYYNGAWQPTRTSDPNLPTTLGSSSPLGFDRSRLNLSAAVEDDTLRIRIGGPYASSFLLFNTHSLPVRAEDLRAEDLPFSFHEPEGPQRYLSVSEGTLTASYATHPIDPFFPSPMLRRPLLNNGTGAWTVEPRHDLVNRWDAPFFYGDSRHVFYVSTDQQPVTITKIVGYGRPTKIQMPHPLPLPPVVCPPVGIIPDRTGEIVSGRNVGISDPEPVVRFVTEDAYIKRALGTPGAVQFGAAKIGPAGSLAKQ
ncbi:neuraminidase-like domain-containing protein [Streptomyces sp. NPDC059755]|uniref:neuraminidase-like domain-containing protein n=1 Tax=Streptomyces sp. NPDC059755 TaxID=3346934 RepID=UPI0036678951